MDTYAMQAKWHMWKYGTAAADRRQRAKNPVRALNDKAQYRFQMTTESVLQDRPVSYPLTAPCARRSATRGGAALLEGISPKLPAAVKERAIRIAGVFSGGKYRKLDEPGLTRAASDKAYKMAGLGPEDIDVAEVHDATSFCEIYQCEMLRFCPEGEGGKFVESGATGPGGKLPVNTSGGLVSKGHPVGATGLSMLAELAAQLRGEAGQRQVKGAEIALAENGGGVIGMEEAVASVVILQRG
jgi:acetyl-CoA acetyltransferase